MPRHYRLGERAAQMGATRDRILEAAISLFTELGISGTTLRHVGERADVAPGTLRNHFPSREDLERAMVERLLAEAPLPDLRLLDGAGSLEERLHRLALATGRFLDGAARIYRMWLREPMLTGPWAESGAAYGARWDKLMRAALGPLADDNDALALLRAVMQPTFYDALRTGTRTTDEVSDLVAAIISPWLAGRLEPDQRTSPQPSKRRGPVRRGSDGQPAPGSRRGPPGRQPGPDAPTPREP